MPPPPAALESPVKVRRKLTLEPSKPVLQVRPDVLARKHE